MIEKLKKIIMDKINAYPPNKKNLPVRAELASIHEFIKNHECGWISVEDRLPSLRGSVLVSGNFGYVTLAEYVGKGNWEFAELMLANDKVTHWMPLPQLPQ